MNGSPSSGELQGFRYRFVPGEPSRTLLMLHGTGGDENDLLELGRALAPSSALLSPRGQVLENGMPRFFRRLAEGVFDEADLHRRTDELAAFIAAACDAHHLNPDRVTAVGFSNGANIAASLLLKHSSSLASAVLLRAMVPFEPTLPIDLQRRPVLMLNGQRDPIIPVGIAERLAAILRAANADVTLEWNPGGHGLTQADVAAAQRWLAAMSRAPES